MRDAEQEPMEEAEPIITAQMVNTVSVELTPDEYKRLLSDYLNGYRTGPLKKSLSVNKWTDNYTVILQDRAPLSHATVTRVVCPDFTVNTIRRLKSVLQKAISWLAKRGLPTIDTNADEHHLILNAGLLAFFLERIANGTMMAAESMLWSDAASDVNDHTAPEHKTYTALRLAQIFTKDSGKSTDLGDVVDRVVNKIEHFLTLI